MARLIQKQIGGDLHLLQTQEKYPTDFDELRDLNHEEMAEGYLPLLVESDLDVSQYDTVFIGYPNWWASIPMPVASFLEEYDFSGKTIVPFCSHGGGRFGQSLTAIAKLAPDATMGEGLSTHYSGVDTLPDDIAAWLEVNEILK